MTKIGMDIPATNFPAQRLVALRQALRYDLVGDFAHEVVVTDQGDILAQTVWVHTHTGELVKSPPVSKRDGLVRLADHLAWLQAKVETSAKVAARRAATERHRNSFQFGVVGGGDKRPRRLQGQEGQEVGGVPEDPGLNEGRLLPEERAISG